MEIIKISVSEKTKPIQACPERSRMEPIARRWPGSLGREDKKGPRGKKLAALRVQIS